MEQDSQKAVRISELQATVEAGSISEFDQGLKDGKSVNCKLLQSFSYVPAFAAREINEYRWPAIG